nr:immunoglobulin heavy chain junction region [Mus musculus]MBK4186065.1 immunoglobulin heavy chain junction region [Mus musculus]MBK4186066.1 immunoglobulin heavy chain junction region [Mus musculus]MBK4186067.1 immunoglobulin heavy chain junction region [Mus musculus]
CASIYYDPYFDFW